MEKTELFSNVERCLSNKCDGCTVDEKEKDDCTCMMVLMRELYNIVDNNNNNLNEKQQRLLEIKVGEICQIGGFQFIVCEHTREGTVLILKDLLHEMEAFGDNNNYNDSNVDRICNDFGEKIKGIVGEENLVEHVLDLTSDDGLKDYGVVTRLMSLITCDMYRRYVEIFDKHKLDAWWWLATPWSTPTHEDSSWVKCVSPHGNFDYGSCNINCGLRPFCILKSNIFVSK